MNISPEQFNSKLNPDTSEMNVAEQYIKSKRTDAYRSLTSCKRVYLDTNYWIRLREAQRNTNPLDRELLEKVMSLVKRNKCIFPISEITFWEILKQSDFESLRQSASIVDKLSKGISIINEDERRTLEILSFMRKAQEKGSHETSELVWSKLSMNILYPILPQPENLEMKKSLIDYISALSFSDMITVLEQNKHYEPFFFQDNIDFLNEAKEKYKNENNSFEQMFLSELGGYVDLFKESLNQAMIQLYYWDTGRYPTLEEKAGTDQNLLRNVIYNFFKLKKATTEFPSYSILPELFAAVRWNTTRKHSDGNDTMDFLHASAALPYFDFFFTERELNTIIRQRKLDARFNCVVESDPNKVLEILNSL